MRHDLEMDGIAADDAAERDRAVIRQAAPVRGVDGERNRARYFQRARHADAVELGAGFLQRLRGAGQERVRDLVVIARLDDEDARTFARALTTLASPRPGHLPAPVRAWWYQAGRVRTSAAKFVNAPAAWTPTAAPHSAPSDRPRH